MYYVYENSAQCLTKHKKFSLGYLHLKRSLYSGPKLYSGIIPGFVGSHTTMHIQLKVLLLLNMVLLNRFRVVF